MQKHALISSCFFAAYLFAATVEKQPAAEIQFSPWHAADSIPNGQQQIAQQSIGVSISLFVQAWQRRDAEAVGRLFWEESTFTNYQGMFWNGRKEIVDQHAKAFKEIFADSILYGRPRGISVRMSSENLAVVHWNWRLIGALDRATKRKVGTRDGTMEFVFVRDLENKTAVWKIKSAQNADSKPASIDLTKMDLAAPGEDLIAAGSGHASVLVVPLATYTAALIKTQIQEISVSQLKKILDYIYDKDKRQFSMQTLSDLLEDIKFHCPVQENPADRVKAIDQFLERFFEPGPTNVF